MTVVTAQITLDRAWLMDPTNPATAIVAGTSGSLGGGTRSNEAQLDADFRPYVGRVRMIVRSVTARTYTIALRNLSKNDMDTVESWKGRLLLLRDIYGRRVWGSYNDTTRLEYTAGNFAGIGDVQFTFTEITYTDAV